MKRTEPATPRRILLVRTSALGDVVHTLPVASAVRAAFPAARIAWVVEEPFAPLVASHPAVDETIPVALRRWRQKPLRRPTRQAFTAFRRRLRGFQADVAIDLMGNHKGALLTLLSGARRRIGAARHHRREPSSALWLAETVVPTGDHAVDRTLSLLATLAVRPSTPDFSAAALLRRDGNEEAPGSTVTDAPEPSGYILIQPGAGWGNKRYPPQWWGAVANSLAAAGERVRVLAGPGEEPLAAAVAAAAPSVRVVMPSSLVAMAGWLRGARLLLGGDTGPLHLAHALGTPVLALHGPTDPMRHGPYGAPERAMFRQLPCSFCYKRFTETKACLLELTPARVAGRAQSLLSSR